MLPNSNRPFRVGAVPPQLLFFHFWRLVLLSRKAILIVLMVDEWVQVMGDALHQVALVARHHLALASSVRSPGLLAEVRVQPYIHRVDRFYVGTVQALADQVSVPILGHEAVAHLGLVGLGHPLVA
mmetsp:Transcript_595/g.681  ORF Transcript_595/g.681 Transcript_595/m.681 type:complete len:126 (-) Transcript_595:1799-2176(-)